MAPPAVDRAAARRAADALFARAGDVLTAGVRVLTGRGAPARPPAVAAPERHSAAPDTEEPQAATSGEAAAARIDAARERLRATIAPPAEDETDPAPDA